MNLSTTKRVLPGLGERVRLMRQSLSMTLAVAAVRSHTSPQLWIQLERYDLATTRTLSAVASVLGVSVDDLVGRPVATGNTTNDRARPEGSAR